MTPEQREELIARCADKCARMDIGMVDWLILKGVDVWIAHRLLVVPTPDGDVDAHACRTISPRRMGDALHAAIESDSEGEHRLAAGLYLRVLGRLDRGRAEGVAGAARVL